MVYIAIMKVDVLQVFISTSAIVGIGLLWINLNEKVFKTVRCIAAAPFSWPKKKDDSSGDCSEARPPEPQLKTD